MGYELQGTLCNPYAAICRGLQIKGKNTLNQTSNLSHTLRTRFRAAGHLFPLGQWIDHVSAQLEPRSQQIRLQLEGFFQEPFGFREPAFLFQHQSKQVASFGAVVQMPVFKLASRESLHAGQQLAGLPASAEFFQGKHHVKVVAVPAVPVTVPTWVQEKGSHPEPDEQDKLWVNPVIITVGIKYFFD